MREKAKINLNYLKNVLATVANPRSLDEAKPVSYFDNRYNDEANQVSVSLENLTASTQELSPCDYAEEGLLAENLEEVLEVLLLRSKRRF